MNILDKTKHPFYEHSYGDFFVVEEGDQVLGRIAMLDNRNFNNFHHSKVAFFGYFEVVENIEVARLLLQKAIDWAKEHDLDTIIGPRGVVGIDGSVLVEGFEHRPALTIPWNYPYYDAFIKDSGFEKDTDYLSGYARGDHEIPPRLYEIAAKGDQFPLYQWRPDAGLLGREQSAASHAADDRHPHHGRHGERSAVVCFDQRRQDACQNGLR